MKKIFMLTAAISLSIMQFTAYADYYRSLTFLTTADSYTMSIDGLSISFSSDNMTATNNETTLTLPLASLTKMFFSGTINTSLEETGSQGVAAIDYDAPATLYSANGALIGTYPTAREAVQQSAAGIYILQQGIITQKIEVK